MVVLACAPIGPRSGVTLSRFCVCTRSYRDALVLVLSTVAVDSCMVSATPWLPKPSTVGPAIDGVVECGS